MVPAKTKARFLARKHYCVTPAGKHVCRPHEGSHELFVGDLVDCARGGQEWPGSRPAGWWYPMPHDIASGTAIGLPGEISATSFTNIRIVKNDEALGYLPYVTQYCFRAGHRASRWDFGRIQTRKNFNIGPPAAEGWPEGRF